MDRRGNRDEKPTYEQLASVLRYIVNVQKNLRCKGEVIL
jgi:hypothetical protein